MSFWNTIEQYVGLKLSAASRFSDKNISKTRKVQNRHFSQFEQYAGLEAPALPELFDSGGQEQGFHGPFGPWIQGVPRVPKGSKAVK